MNSNEVSQDKKAALMQNRTRQTVELFLSKILDIAPPRLVNWARFFRGQLTASNLIESEYLSRSCYRDDAIRELSTSGMLMLRCFRPNLVRICVVVSVLFAALTVAQQQSSANDVLVEVSFTANNFSLFAGTGSPPVTAISGSWSGRGTLAPLPNFCCGIVGFEGEPLTVNLNIGGFVYTPQNTSTQFSFFSDGTTMNDFVLGGINNGRDAVASDDNDFNINIFNLGTQGQMIYSTVGSRGQFISTDFQTTFKVTNVPEPPTLLSALSVMTGVGLVSIQRWRVRRERDALIR